MRFSRMLVVSVAVLWAALAVAVPAQAQTEAELAYREAKAAIEKGELEKARDLLVTASQTDDKNPDIFLLLGKTEYQLGNVEKAIQAWRHTLQLAPKQAYAKRMLDALSGHVLDADVRLRIASGLLRDGLLKPARQELTKLSFDKTLSDKQRIEYLLLDADYYVQSGSGEMALDRLQELAVRYPDEPKKVRTLLLLGRADLCTGGDLVPRGLAQLRQVIADHADTPEADAAQFELISYELTEDPTAVGPLVAWIKAHADHRSAGAARRRLVAAIGQLLTAAQTDTEVQPDSELTKSDTLALATAAEAYPLLTRAEDAQSLTEKLLGHIEERYVQNKALAAATTAVERLLASPLPPSAKEAAERTLGRVAEAVAAGAYEKIAFEIERGSTDTTALVTWIADHPQHPLIDAARKQLVTAHLAASAKATTPSADAGLNESDLAALAAAAEAIKGFDQSKDSLELTQQLIKHFETQYAAHKAFAAAIAGVEKLVAVPLPPSSQVLAQQAIKRINDQAATAEYGAILVKLAEGESAAAELAAWIAAHPKHDSAGAARQKLIEAYFEQTKKGPPLKADASLSESDAAALVVAGQMLAEYETAAESLSLVQTVVTHFEKYYAAHKAYQAAIAGIQGLLKFPLPASSRSHALHALARLQTSTAIDQLTADAANGRIKPGPLPASLAAVVNTYATLNKEFPATPTWQLQAGLANQVNGLAKSVPWPDRITEPKPPHHWALEIAFPVAESGDAAAAKTAIETISVIVAECAALKQESAQGMATQIHGRLLAAIEPAQDAWPAAVLHHVDLLGADARAIFDKNLRTGRRGENAKLNQAQLEAIGALKKLLGERPAHAAQALGKLNELVQVLTEHGHYAAAERAHVELETSLPVVQRRQSQLTVAALWIKQVTERHQRLTAAGFRVPHELDPLHTKALVRCYEMERGLDAEHEVVARARALRSAIVSYYQDLEFFDVAEAAIRVNVEQRIDSADAFAELQSAGLQLTLAKRELARQLKQHKGREGISLTDAFKTVIAAYKKFITDRPTNPLVSQAVDQLFGIGQTFQSHERYEVAAALYRDLEAFAQGVETLMQAAPGSPNTAERAALAVAGSLHTQATQALAKERSKQPSDAKPPAELSDEYVAAIAAYRAIVVNYPDGPLVGTAIQKIKSIGLQYAKIDAWDVADKVYADLLEQKLDLRYPEKLEFARALCLLGKVMPEHARQVLTALSQTTRGLPGRGETMIAGIIRGDLYHSPLDLEKHLAHGRSIQGESGGGAASSAEEPEKPPASGPKPDAAKPVAEPAPIDPGADAEISALELADKEVAKREATLLAAVRRQQSSLATRVAQMRDQAIKLNVQQTEQQAQQAVAPPAAPVLSDAEIDRRQKVLDAAYSAFQALATKYPHTPTAAQARGEIMVVLGHWRGIGQWQRAADLAKRFLTDNPRDAELPKIRQEIARDYLAWAGQGCGKGKSKQEMLDTVSMRFRKARDELASIVTDFPEDDTLRQQAQWDVANSYLAQARVVAAFSPTLARGQYVRSADELLRVAELYHDHPQIGTIPQMLWSISNELTSRAYHDEAIMVWNELTIHYPMHELARQAALRIAQTYQTQLKQPLRAVEAYVELNFATGGGDASLQQTIFQIAVQLKGKKRWVEALHVLETFADSFPQHAQAGQALTMIGQIHQTNEAWEDAIAAYQRVIDEYQNGDWVKQARWSIAECTINLSRWQQAITAYREFVASYAEDEKVAEANRRMDVLKSLARYQKVADEKGQRKAFDAQYQIGTIVRSQLSNPVKAIIEYRKVAKNWPESHLADDALYQVGAIYLERAETEKAREALLAVAEKYPASPLADDALFMVGTSYESEAQRLSAVTRTKSIELANDLAQRQAYAQSQDNRRMNLARGQFRVTQLKQAGKLAEADSELANFAARNKAFDFANAQVIANWSRQQAEVLTAQQLADRQDKINAALRRAVESFRKAAALVSGDRADDALLRMARIYDKQLEDADAAMATWLEIVEQFTGTAVAEDASWRIAQYYEQHGQHDKAIGAYQSFLRNYRTSTKAGDAQMAIAENYEHLGKWVNAMDEYTNYLNKFPKGPLVNRAREQITWIKTYRL